MDINGSTIFTGIIGKPVHHSLSPIFQNAAFEAAGLNWVYLAFEVEPGGLEKCVFGLAAAGCRGLNVTMPYKQAIIPYIDELSDTAAAAGAVNTIEFNDGRMIGHNTDGDGLIASLKADAGFMPAGKSVLLIGAGGAARSIGMALGRSGASSIKVLNRNEQKAEELIRLIDSRFSDCTVTSAKKEGKTEDYDLIVNATSVGMESNPGLPLAVDGIRPEQVVYDVVYWPLVTEFVRAARSNGARTIGGLRMLLFQGIKSFGIWTGREAPVGAMAQALERYMMKKDE